MPLQQLAFTVRLGRIDGRVAAFFSLSKHDTPTASSMSRLEPSSHC